MPEMLFGRNFCDKLSHNRSSVAYKNPTKNLVTISIHTFVEKDEAKEAAKAIELHQCITFFRPPCRQSARKPQNSELLTTPASD